MKTLTTLFAILATPMAVLAGELKIEKVQLETLDFEVPKAIQLRVEMAKLQEKESIARNEKDGFEGAAVIDLRTDLSYFSHVYRASDGMTFLVDSCHMALWVRENEGWKCIVTNVTISKTFGGAFPTFPVQYLGNGMFAISETVPEKIEEKSDRGFPLAIAVTYLIDSRDGRLKERSEKFVYDHNPPVRVPEEWLTKYKLEALPER